MEVIDNDFFAIKVLIFLSIASVVVRVVYLADFCKTKTTKNKLITSTGYFFNSVYKQWKMLKMIGHR